MPRPNRGARLSDRPNEHGHWEIRWTESGRSKRRSTWTADRAQANQILAGFILQKDRQDSASAAPLTNDVLDWYRDGHVAERVEAKERVKYALLPLREFFGDMAVDEIEPEDVDDYVARRRSGKIGRKVKDATIRRELGVLVAACNKAVKRKKLDRAHVPVVELPDKSAPRDRWLTPDEARRLSDAAGKSHVGKRLTRAERFVALALETASRKRALETLTWFQVDLEQKLIKLNPDGRRQTRKRRPSVPISDALLPILKRAFEEKISEHVLDHDGEIRTSFENAVRRAGLSDDVTPHTLRHTWATWAAQRGVPLWKIAGVLGDTYATVEKNYLHHCPEHLRDAVNYHRGGDDEKAGDAGAAGDGGVRSDERA